MDDYNYDVKIQNDGVRIIYDYIGMWLAIGQVLVTW